MDDDGSWLAGHRPSLVIIGIGLLQQVALMRSMI
jgi:hypothetical protein